MIARVKGTQDFLDLTLYNFLIDQLKHHLVTYHFTEIATPILEPTELFKRALGLYTDVVSKEMFTIQPHAESSEQICLRPEVTAPTIRAFLEHHIETKPWQVFSYGPMFRYERPQKGRFRQFHQINIEVIGTNSIANDAQFIAMIERFFHDRLTMNNHVLLINFLGCPHDRIAYREKLKLFLVSHNAVLCNFCQVRTEQNTLRVFDCKNESCQALYEQAPYIVDNLCTPCTKEWLELQELLTLLSVSFAYNPKLVRGLDYYSKTIFEFVSTSLGAQSAFGGGGRYELATVFGASSPVPSIGAAFGIERILMLLEPLRATLPIPQLPALHVIMPLTAAQQPLALLIADALRAEQFVIDVMLEDDSIKNMMRKANKMGARTALIIGETEQKNGTVTLKDMMTGQQQEVKQSEIAKIIKR